MCLLLHAIKMLLVYFLFKRRALCFSFSLFTHKKQRFAKLIMSMIMGAFFLSK